MHYFFNFQNLDIKNSWAKINISFTILALHGKHIFINIVSG